MDDSTIRKVKESTAENIRLAHHTRFLITHSRMLLLRIYQGLVQEERDRLEKIRSQINNRAIGLYLEKVGQNMRATETGVANEPRRTSEV